MYFPKTLLLKQKIMETVFPIPTFLHNSVLFKCSKLALNFICFHLNILNSYVLSHGFNNDQFMDILILEKIHHIIPYICISIQLEDILLTSTGEEMILNFPASNQPDDFGKEAPIGLLLLPGHPQTSRTSLNTQEGLASLSLSWAVN